MNGIAKSYWISLIARPAANPAALPGQRLLRLGSRARDWRAVVLMITWRRLGKFSECGACLVEDLDEESWSRRDVCRPTAAAGQEGRAGLRGTKTPRQPEEQEIAWGWRGGGGGGGAQGGLTHPRPGRCVCGRLP